jgi:hypothetical protein
LNAFYPCSFPLPRHLPIEEPVTAAEPKSPPESTDLAGTAEFSERSKLPEPTNSDPAVPAVEILLSRKQVARRWGCSTETVKRRERAGILRSVRFNGRNIRYRLVDVERVEQQAENLIIGS